MTQTCHSLLDPQSSQEMMGRLLGSDKKLIHRPEFGSPPAQGHHCLILHLATWEVNRFLSVHFLQSPEDTQDGRTLASLGG